ncbi:hypothetical protein PP707_02195 [Acetobacter pasteurianus]|nr:hypothetical protein [Acetobacter pasteurianus]
MFKKTSHFIIARYPDSKLLLSPSLLSSSTDNSLSLGLSSSKDNIIYYYIQHIYQHYYYHTHHTHTHTTISIFYIDCPIVS